MHQVWPPATDPTGPTGALSDSEVQALYRMPSDRPFVRTNFVTSLDGSVQGPDGRSGTINTPTDTRLFSWLRALSDVVLVGAGTARSEGYRAVQLSPDQQAVRAAAGLPGVPTLAVVSRSLKLEPWITDVPDRGHVIAVTGAVGDDHHLTEAGVEIMRAPGPGGVDVGRALEWLAGRGLTRVVCEGGPSLHRQLLAENLVDEICLTVVGQVVGGYGPRLVDGPPVSAAFALDHLLIDDDTTMFSRWRRTGPGSAG